MKPCVCDGCEYHEGVVCGTLTDFLYSPDIDIAPVPLCTPCLYADYES